MSFRIDKQTLEELNLLGKFRQGSVYHLFNQVKTRGGEQLMEEMFRDPLQDASAINLRTEIFRYFQEANVHFSFDVQQLSGMREYLDTGASRSTVAALISIVVKEH